MLAPRCCLCWLWAIGAWQLAKAQVGEWTRLGGPYAGTHPSQRHSHTAVFEDRDKTMMIFGGVQSVNTWDNTTVPTAMEVWQFYRQNNDWVKKWESAQGSTSPPNLWDHAAVYFSSHMYIIGGRNSASFVRHFWSFAVINNVWEDKTTESVPLLWGHSAVWYPGAGTGAGAVIVFGGMTLDGTGASVTSNKVYYYEDFSGSFTWITPEAASLAPTARYYHSAAYAETQNKMMVHGGFDGVNYLSDLWTYTFDGNYWTEVTWSGAFAPAGRRSHVAFFDTIRGCLLIFGGQALAADGLPEYFRDLWRFCVEVSEPNWEFLQPEVGYGAPAKRTDAAGVWDPFANVVLIFGGNVQGNSVHQDTWEWDPTGVATSTTTSTILTTVTQTTTATKTSVTATTTENLVTVTATTTETLVTVSATTTETSVIVTTVTETSLASREESTTGNNSEPTSTTATVTSTSTSFTTTPTTSQSVTMTSVTSSSSTASTTTVSTTTVSTTTVSTVTVSTMTVSTTTSSTTLYENIVIPETLNGTVGGEVIANTLQAVIDSLASSAPEVRSSTPTGEVTIRKLDPTPSGTGAYENLEVSTELSGQMTVLLPASALSSIEGNKMLVVTELAETVRQQLPTEASSTNADTGTALRGTISSHILEISLASESAGTVQVAELNGLAEPIYFRLREGNSIEGDACVFYDPNLGQWSFEGTQLAVEVPGESGSVAGTWCQTTHLSLFAVMQTIDFSGVLADDEDATTAAAGAVAVATLVICGLGLTVLCFLVKRRLQRPVKGQAVIRDARGGTRTFDFTRGKLMTPVESAVSSSKGKPQKILVQWHLNPDSVKKQIHRFNGLRRYSVDLQPAAAPMVHETSVFSAKTKSLRNLEDAEREALCNEPEVEDEYVLDSVVSVGPAGLPPAEILDKLFPIEAEGNQPSNQAGLDRQAYDDGQDVLYHSETHGRVLPAVIVGPGYFYGEGDEEAEWPLYTCKVGVKLREMVTMSRLRAPLEEGAVVSVMQDLPDGGPPTWVTGHILHAPEWKITHLVKYPTYDVLLSDGSRCNCSFEKLRRKFDLGQLVEVYMGRNFGWVYGTCGEELLEDWGSDREAVTQTMQVVLLKDKLSVTVPSFLVRGRPVVKKAEI